ncbi:MAG: nitrogen regulation protein NR(I) [Thiotrichaceae bacterium]|nr:nitrogen regulation protein NR(I) [Thiotrichaceae bacterium]
MPHTKNIWIIDDDKSIRWVLEKALARENLPVKVFVNADKALKLISQEQPCVIFSDIRMPGSDGLQLLSQVKEQYPNILIIIMTAHSDLDTTVNAFKSGAFEYLAKPFDLIELVDVAKRAMEQYEHNIAETEDKLKTINNNLNDNNFIGQSPAIQRVFHVIGRLSKSSIPVLITGESGSGKELIAKALHTHSPRSNQPFIAINTAAIPNELIESELFGHEKGAFTGAYNQRKGHFEQANNGTLFFDEIGDMPSASQTRLLRVLSDGEFFRVGGHHPVKVDVRIIAATHQDLEQRVKDKEFREDLFHRLNVIHIKSPALRERADDIPLLLKHFLKNTAEELDVEAKSCSAETMAFLQAKPWPGNIRQLENLARWLTVMVASKEVAIEDLSDDLRQNNLEQEQSTHHWESALKQFALQALQQGTKRLMDITTPSYERIMIQAALSHTAGRKKEAAELLGLGRNTLTRKITDLNIT